MSATFLMVAKVVVMTTIWSPFPVSVTTYQTEVGGGFDPAGKCRKLEEAAHEGYGPVITQGNKHITRADSLGGKHVTETTTYCVEL